MRPIKLTMSAFESYLDKTEVDFNRLGKNGIYLISGDTGAGKTTIFDAITFALYGTASGDKRDAAMLRSHFAGNENPTFVELEFEAKGKIYKVFRNPSYMRKSKKGNGETEEAANATLTFISDANLPPVSGVDKVTELIKEIIGLDKTQFCSIAMIAQGAFQKILLSDTKDKIPLFRELFNTEKYQLLEESLKSEASTAFRALDDFKKRLLDKLNGLSINEDEEIFESIERMRKVGIVTEEEVTVLISFVKEDSERLAEVVKKIEKTDRSISKNEEKINAENLRLQAVNQKTAMEAELEKGRQQQEIFKVQYEKAQEASKEKPSLIEKQTRIKDTLDDYAAVSDIEQKIRLCRGKISDDEKKLEILEAGLKKLLEMQEKNKAELENLKTAGESKIQLENESQKQKEEQKEILEISSDLKKYDLCVSEQKNAAQAYKAAEENFEKINQLYLEKRKLFNMEQAGILAELLEDGIPCPVCGSKEHPSPAKKSQQAPEKAEVDSLENDASEAKNLAGKKASFAASKKAETEAVENQIDEKLKKHFENLTVKSDSLKQQLENKIVETNDALTVLSEKIAAENKNVQRKNFLEKELPELEAKISSTKDELNSCKTEVEKNKVFCQSEEKNLAEKKAKLEFSGYEEANQNCYLIGEQIQKLDAALENAAKAKADCESGISAVEGKIKLLCEQLSQMKVENLSKLEEEHEELVREKGVLNGKRDGLNTRMGRNKDNVLEIEKLIPQINSCEEYYTMVSSLYDVVTGKTKASGQDKISLETYVQMIFLERITARANLRLKVMTDGQYELLRRTEKGKGGGKHGLELNVRDFYTGREREVQSLSGGEQFQASLALALGFADEIQNSSGGIKLDSIFIDEGFGTLDSETLNKAMKALEDLSRGDKLVGIISHVEELETRIPNKIYVTKNQKGVSRLEIIND